MGLRLSFVSASQDLVRLSATGVPERGLANVAFVTHEDGAGALETPWAEALEIWTTRYRAAIDCRNRVDARRAALLGIGQEMGAWLETALGDMAQWPLVSGRRLLEIAVSQMPVVEEHLLMDAPWELLADRHAHLASQDVDYVIWRSHGRKPDHARAWEPQHENLALMFMAASPDGVTELDYEAEEAAILSATEGMDNGIALHVEETGCLQQLHARLRQEERPFEALHISCHGDVWTEEQAAQATTA